MKWPGFIQKCFGDRDERANTESAQPSRTKASPTRLAKPQPPSHSAKLGEQQDQTAVAQSSGTVSERQRSEQSQSEATQTTTQPTSTQSSNKVNSEADEITCAKPAPKLSLPPTVTGSDPDEITPVQTSESKYSNVKDALEDRRKLYERLRRKPEGEPPPSEVNVATQQAPGIQSDAEGIKPVDDEQGES